jgi:hypothetical protein
MADDSAEMMARVMVKLIEARGENGIKVGVDGNLTLWLSSESAQIVGDGIVINQYPYTYGIEGQLLDVVTPDLTHQIFCDSSNGQSMIVDVVGEKAREQHDNAVLMSEAFDILKSQLEHPESINQEEIKSACDIIPHVNQLIVEQVEREMELTPNITREQQPSTPSR